MMTTISGRISRKKKKRPAGATRRAVTALDRELDEVDAMRFFWTLSPLPLAGEMPEGRMSYAQKKGAPTRLSANPLPCLHTGEGGSSRQADLKRAMISARSGLVKVAAAPNSRLVRRSAAG